MSNKEWVEHAERIAANYDDVSYPLHKGIEILENAEFKRGSPPQIFFDGKWRALVRTDLKDDVCTWSPGKVSHLGSEELRAWALDRIRYGIRVRKNGDFSIIDAYSDG